MGRFELLVGEERDGSPVYQQVHSREMPESNAVLLFRYVEKLNALFLYFASGLETTGWLNGKMRLLL